MSSPTSRRRIAGLVAVPVVAAGLLVVPALGRGDTVDATPRPGPLATASPTPAASPPPAPGAGAEPPDVPTAAGTSGATPASVPGPGAPADPSPAPGPAADAPTADPVATDPGAPAAATDPVAPDPGAPAAAGPDAVDVRVTVHGWDAGRAVAEVVALVAAVQDDGTCVLTLRGPGGVVATAPTAAVPDVSTTVCGLLTVERRRLVPGTWQATVTYASGRSTGTSAPVTIEVP